MSSNNFIFNFNITKKRLYLFINILILIDFQNSYIFTNEMNKKKIKAAILIIGNEILSGRTKDLNVSFIC